LIGGSLNLIHGYKSFGCRTPEPLISDVQIGIQIVPIKAARTQTLGHGHRVHGRETSDPL
jgi:hypothetical protein